MLFNSYVFLLCFLPATLLIYQFVSRFHRKVVIIWLGCASLIFYGYWQPRFLLVLGSSILFNYLASCLISRRLPNTVSKRFLLWFAIGVNLGALCWFKYLFPVLNFASTQFRAQRHWVDVLLPLGISFFTFTQIAYLVDLEQGAAEQQDFFSYLLFVTFFPHLIAGPILHHRDIMPQFQQDRKYGLSFNDLSVGFSWFAMGLGKKVLLADTLAPTANLIFGVNGNVGSAMAWVGALSYVFQLYFDFSGYCDMACGLARMFSIDFPLNFSSPYKAASIIEFWQRWHMTLTQYIGSYLYSPIQFLISARRQGQGKKVSRKAQATLEGFLQMVALPTVVTMFFAGIWHGAGLQFMVFGLLHGFYLTINHGWRIFRHARKLPDLTGAPGIISRVGRVMLTFLCVLFSLVFFRASSFQEGVAIIKRLALTHSNNPPLILPVTREQLIQLTVAAIIVWSFPNTQQILARYKPALALAPSDQGSRRLSLYWKPSLLWGLVLGSVILVALVNLQNPSSFLYFQF